MNLDQALRRYREGQFSDADVTRCTRSYRELIRTGAVCTITEDRGRGLVRLCDATVFKRGAIIAALNKAGWSLAVAGQIALGLPFRSLLYETCDPLQILLESWAHVDPQSGAVTTSQGAVVNRTGRGGYARERNACVFCQNDPMTITPSFSSPPEPPLP
jgi:hypothetical protein